MVLYLHYLFILFFIYAGGNLKNFKPSGSSTLLLATLIWSSSFVILKRTLDNIPVLWTLSMRFLIAAAVIAVFASRRLAKIDLEHLKCGIAMGFLLFMAYVFQTYGLDRTTPGKNAFLTDVYCILVPFMAWISTGKRPDKFNISSALMCLVGIGLVSLDNDFSIGIGDGLTLIGGIFYALHIIVTAKSAWGHDVVILTFLQLSVAGILALISATLFETFPSSIPSSSALGIAYLSVVCTAVTFFLQTYGQKHTNPSQASVILCLESVFGTIISAALGEEEITAKLLTGFALIFFSVIISETKLDFLQKRKHPKHIF